MLRCGARRAAMRGGVRSLRRRGRPLTTLPAGEQLGLSLREADPELFDILEREKRRQRDSVVLIPSENFTSRAVLEALGSVMQNKYSEGYPGARYYGGNEFIDRAESLCQERALAAFRLDPEEWGVNVQPLSGSPANFAVYNAVLQPHDRIMSLDLPHGGHLSHGYSVPGKKISAVSKYWESMPYRLNEATGLIDYDALEASARLFRPKLLVGGASAYSRHVDYARMRAVADEHGAVLLSDMAHISGLVAAGVSPSPFEHADVVTTTTHKSLRGPRAGMIFYRRGPRRAPGTVRGPPLPEHDLEPLISQSVFPGMQGGPHNHTIAALAAALRMAAQPAFREYQERVVRNSAALCEGLRRRGLTIVSGGTDNHMVLVDLRPLGVTGSKVERVLDLANVAVNKNTVPGDRSAMNPGGIRLGSPAMTTRGATEADFDLVADFVHRGVQAALDRQGRAAPSKKLVDFVAVGPAADEATLHADVAAFARSLPVVGFDEQSMVYR